MQENKKISVYLVGEGILQGYGSADPVAEEIYKGTVCHTFDGYVQAAVRSTNREGTIRVTFSSEGCEPLIVDLRNVGSIKGGI